MPEEVKDRDEQQEKATLTDDISGYPNHVESFETYYFLGESRTLKSAAYYRFQQTSPDCPPNDPRFTSKFESFYTKFKRWARKENWSEWVKRKEIEERHKREAEIRERLGSISRVLRGYQGVARQAIIVFSDKVKVSSELRQAVLHGDQPRIDGLMARERIEIRNFKELREMVELDIEISKILEQQPEVPEERSTMPEAAEEKVDKLMELLRRKSLDTVPGGDGGEDDSEEDK
jgi:hypothetical protein